MVSFKQFKRANAANRNKKKIDIYIIRFPSSKTSFFPFPHKKRLSVPTLSLFSLRSTLPSFRKKKKSFPIIHFNFTEPQLESTFLFFSRATLQWFKQQAKSALYTWPERPSNWSTRATERYVTYVSNAPPPVEASPILIWSSFHRPLLGILEKPFQSPPKTPK